MKKKAILVDIDGTLANNEHRHPFDYHLCEDDALIEVVSQMVKSFHQAGEHKIILLSGRPDSCITETVRWLVKHDTPYSHLFMRVTGDFRPDEVVKREIYEQNIVPSFDIDLVIDDRPKVIRMWRSLGLLVADVGKGIEF